MRLESIGQDLEYPAHPMNISRIVFLSLLLASGAQVLWHQSELPERLASHFDGAGNPNGFMPKTTFFELQLAVLGILTAVFILLPALLTRLPNALINLPNKDYWLAPERREATLRDLASHLAWFGTATLAFLAVVMELVFRANLPGGTGRLDPRAMWVLLGVYAVFLIGWLVRMLLRYRKRDYLRSP